MLCFFCKCFFSYHFILKFFHECDSSNHILVFIHGKKTFGALQCQMCGTYFNKKTENNRTLPKKSMKVFFMASSQRYQYFIFYQIQHFLRASWASLITTNGINFLMAGPLCKCQTLHLRNCLSV